MVRTSATHQGKARTHTLIVGTSHRQVEGSHVLGMSGFHGSWTAPSGTKLVAGWAQMKEVWYKADTGSPNGTIHKIPGLNRPPWGPPRRRWGARITCHRRNNDGTIKYIYPSRISPKFRPKHFKLRYRRLVMGHDVLEFGNSGEGNLIQITVHYNEGHG